MVTNRKLRNICLTYESDGSDGAKYLSVGIVDANRRELCRTKFVDKHTTKAGSYL